ncbi:MAG: glutathione S-transferase N-terminal domain-containing protein [Solirubrobacteraceae bacterium]
MPAKLHRCSTTWVKGPHPCWQVQKALDEQGVDYEVVRHPVFPRGRRKDYIALSGQKLFPAIELEDGRVIREESKDLVARIREGRLSA